MAAIDKMYLKNYFIFDEFRLWCLIHNPKLLKHFYNWNMTLKEWNKWKESNYNSYKHNYEQYVKYAYSVESLQEYYKNRGYNNISLEQLTEEVNDCLKVVEQLKDKESFIADLDLPVTNFSCREDKYLLWHCPIEEIREYLIKQCGYKERWYYKLFFKY